MGEYWKPVNITKEEFIHPHRLGDGLKLGEWNHPGSKTRKKMEEAWARTDDVRALSDYGREMQLWGVEEEGKEVPEYGELEESYTEVSGGSR